MHLHVICITFARPVSRDAAARPDWGPAVAQDIVERNIDLFVAYTSSSSNHHVISACFSAWAQGNGPVTVTLGHGPGCSSFEVISALNSHLESDADITSQKCLEPLREPGQKFDWIYLHLQLSPLKPQRREFKTIWTRSSLMTTSLQSLMNACEMRNKVSWNGSTYLAIRNTKEREGKRDCRSRSAQGLPLDDCTD
eukprot:3433560-Pyramimonas_sp.AAC.1